ERGNGNNKVTVEQQELDLKASVKALGIDTGDLTLSDAMADLVPKKFREDDVIARKGYMLKVADAEMVRKVFMELDRLQIEDAFIHHVSHSKEVEYRRAMRIEAITDAKDRADYMLAAIGERTGPALEVIETPVERKRPGASGAFDRIYGGTTSKRLVELNDNYRALDVGFSRITISAHVGCVFAIAPE
ncbi:MAG: SIMPL domain-containing protein, partial [Flavobacteriales bacterium]|nr:SIMPL domain-containing protein [Flavobacteriales bacterium]